MNNLNSVLLEGDLTRDPLFRQTPRGKSTVTFPIASDRYYKGENGLEKEVGYFDIEAWGKLADACNNQGRKGRSVRVVGRLRQDRWNGADGKTHTRVFIVAEHVEFRPQSQCDVNGEDSPDSEGYEEIPESEALIA
jgi:single-strand DNA-binding protein